MESEITQTDWHAAPGGEEEGDSGGGGMKGQELWAPSVAEWWCHTQRCHGEPDGNRRPVNNTVCAYVCWWGRIYKKPALILCVCVHAYVRDLQEAL